MSALIVPVMEDSPYVSDPAGLCDLAAFTWRRPAEIATRRGAVAWLNARAVMAAHAGECETEALLTVYRHPPSWLRAGAPRHGAIMLDRSVALADLMTVGRFAAEDRAHALDLTAALRREASRRSNCPIPTGTGGQWRLIAA